MSRLVLASASPRRQELLQRLVSNFEVLVADIDESTLAGEDPEDYVLRMARGKAIAVAKRIQAEGRARTSVLGADTIVVLEGRILGKPKDAAEAETMLRALMAGRHLVYTGIALADSQALECCSDREITGVWLRSFSAQGLHSYIASGDPMDKAGAYAVQNREYQPVSRLEGSESNVIGLPLALTRRLLEHAET